MFLVIDWIDGSGKSTQVQLLKQILEKKWKTVMLLDFPRYDEPSSLFVKKFLNWEYGTNLSPEIISLFFALDRFDASSIIRSSIEKYDFVISNRYVSANMIHQAWKILEGGWASDYLFWKIDLFLDWIEYIEYNICRIPRPDTVFFLDVPPDISLQRIEQKQQRNYITEGNKDINEKNYFHQECAYKAGKYISEKCEWRVIDCLQNGKIFSPEQVSLLVLSKIL